MTSKVDGTKGFIGNRALPPGTIIDFAGNVAPAGTLLCPEVPTAVSRETYADLFAAIGTLWGAGDGSTTFGIPYFGAGEVAIQAGSNAVGSATIGLVLNHSHSAFNNRSGIANGNGGNVAVGDGAIGNATITSNPTGNGAAKNYPAGMRVRKCVVY